MNKLTEKIKENLIQINKYPRSSGDEKKISDFIASYARERNLEVYQDDLYNLIIRKKSTIKNHSGPAVILQGHMDMVYVKDDESMHDYSKGIDVLEKDGFLYAKGTSLGGDNGISIAYLMIIMDSKDMIHPDLEIIVTVQEEVGLVGAEHLDTSKLKGKYYINLDAEDEGIFFVSCAGGVRNEVKIPIIKEKTEYSKGLKIIIEGLQGGHSGLEINKFRGNAIKFMGSLLNFISENTEISLSNIACDGKANSIPNKCTATVLCKDVDSVNKTILCQEKIFNNQLYPLDSLIIKVENVEVDLETDVFSSKTFNNIVNTILLMPYGVSSMDKSIEAMVETSSNMGAVYTDSDNLIILSSIRSSIESKKEEQMIKIKTLAAILGNEAVFYNNYPGWEYNSDSMLLNIAKESYTELTGKESISSSIHAGLECGYFNRKIKGLDIIAFGPNLHNVHTSKERLDIQSSENIFNLLITILKKLAD